MLYHDHIEADWPSKPSVPWTWESFQWTISPVHSSWGAVINLKETYLDTKIKYIWIKYTDSYDEEDLLYVWDEDQGVKFLGDVELSQFDLISSPYRNASISRKRGGASIFGVKRRWIKFILCFSEWTPGLYSVLQVSFNLRRKQGYFLIQVYVPCILIVVLSWVSFWLNREATSDRINLGKFQIYYLKNQTWIDSHVKWHRVLSFFPVYPIRNLGNI
jgi:hypothetical protein